MANYIGNALSLGMLDLDLCTLHVEQLSLNDARQLVRERSDWQSCVGHENTARLVSSLLDRDVPMRRVSTSLQPHDQLLVAQYNGPRLPEGATSLPEGAKIRWYLVKVRPPLAAYVEGGELALSETMPDDRDYTIV